MCLLVSLNVLICQYVCIFMCVRVCARYKFDSLILCFILNYLNEYSYYVISVETNYNIIVERARNITKGDDRITAL